jgi:hypothetical protein
MSPLAQYITNICAEATDQQRTRALEVSAQVIPHLKGVYGEMDFFLFSAFALDFIRKGRLPGENDWNVMCDFLNGRTQGSA